MSFADALLLIQATTTLPLIGLILIVQFVVYPQFGNVPAQSFCAYHDFHMRRITRVVAPLFLTEMLASAAMVWWRPEFVSAGEALFGLSVSAILEFSTLLLQIPCHQSLSLTQDAAVIRRLVLTNWLRTGAWCARGVLVVLWLARGLGPGLSGQ